MHLYKKNGDVFTDLGLSEENKMPKKSIVFKDAVCVEKGIDKNIYVYAYIVQIISETIHKKLLTGCFQEEEMNGRTTGDSPLYAIIPLEFQTI